MGKARNNTETSIEAKELREIIKIISKWDERTLQINATWIRMYLQPKLDSVYKKFTK